MIAEHEKDIILRRAKKYNVWSQFKSEIEKHCQILDNTICKEI